VDPVSNHKPRKNPRNQNHETRTKEETMRKILIGAGLLLGAAELAMAFGIEVPAAAAVMGAALIAASLWTMRGGRVSAAVLGVLCLVELVSVPLIWANQDNPPLGDVLTFLGFGIVSLAGVIACIATLTRRHPAIA
jgi:hypothetical protein